jgi:hypothetical protein
MSKMTDETAKAARLLKVVDAVVDEFERQSVAKALVDPLQMPKSSSRQRAAT